MINGRENSITRHWLYSSHVVCAIGCYRSCLIFSSNVLLMRPSGNSKNINELLDNNVVFQKEMFKFTTWKWEMYRHFIYQKCDEISRKTCAIQYCRLISKWNYIIMNSNSKFNFPSNLNDSRVLIPGQRHQRNDNQIMCI